MRSLGSDHDSRGQMAWAEPVEARARGRVLPRPLRRPMRMLQRFRSQVAWRIPERFGFKAVVGFFAATAFAGMLIGGHIGTAISVTSAWAGLAIEHVTITGQSETSEVEVLRALGIDETSSLLTLDAAEARRRIEALPWIETAEIRKFYPGALQVKVSERSAFALWQHNYSLTVIDNEGNVLSPIVAPQYASLLVLVGANANTRAHEITDVLGRFETLQPRVRAAVLIGDRRWNLVLHDGTEILLPVENPQVALEQLMAVDAESSLLSGDIVSVDLRFDDRFIVGLASEAAEARRKALEKARKAAAKNGVRT